ncbi:uncharacterized protein LOC119833422 [Zerene cesonia]|uniref:uncharacterized protein LOC119833422 n=1 Tax=Zerene cesonia TaxID=33412 RepID=UPI0018E54B08|nr:uncharacterized protein LOC119833422 [Zerene cesonia]
MSKVRVRTTEKASWSSDSLNKAIQLIDGGSSIRNAAKVMGIPFSSLQKSIKKGSTLAPHLGRFTVFSREEDAELANLVKKIANIFYGCTVNQIRRVAFEYAEKLNVKHNFNQASKMATMAKYYKNRTKLLYQMLALTTYARTMRMMDDAEDARNRCLVCDEFGRNNEMWYRCTSCGLWAHAECTGWESAESYLCDVC